MPRCRRRSQDATPRATAQAATYAIAEAETMQIVLPADVTRTLDAPLAATPQLVIRADAGEVALNGSFLSSLDETFLSGGLPAAINRTHTRRTTSELCAPQWTHGTDGASCVASWACARGRV
jgi:hypothetical protein